MNKQIASSLKNVSGSLKTICEKHVTAENMQLAIVCAVAFSPILLHAANAAAPAGVPGMDEFNTKFEGLYEAATGAMTGVAGKTFTAISVAIGIASAVGGRVMTAVGAAGLGIACQVMPAALDLLFGAAI